MTAGKIPWQSFQVTDYFWDRDLSPLGLHLKHRLSSDDQIHIAYLKPLNGAMATIGDIQLIQYVTTLKWQDFSAPIAPWWLNYHGQPNAHYAKRDTQWDNQLLQLALKISYQNFRLGIDIGHSMTNSATITGKAQQQDALAIEFSHGTLKKPDDWLT